jgi:hypothetical protein
MSSHQALPALYSTCWYSKLHATFLIRDEHRTRQKEGFLSIFDYILFVLGYGVRRTALHIMYHFGESIR